MESAVKQLLIGLVTLDIVDTDSLVQAWKSLEVVPRSSIGAEYFNYFRNNHKISFEIGACRTTFVGHQPETIKTATTFLVQFSPPS